MTEFNIDFLHPEQFARTWVDGFVGPQGWRRLGVAYAIVVLLTLVPVLAHYYLGQVADLRATLRAERQRLTALQTQVVKQQHEMTQQRSLLSGLSELETFHVAWTAVLQALSERMPGDRWLNRIELVQPEAKSMPPAVSGAAPAATPPRLFRLEVVTELRPGNDSVLGIAKFLDDLEQDRRFSKEFQMQDWEASPDVLGTGEQRQQRLILTVSFKKLP